MSEYQGLSYKTFGGADPREKSRVYYCAHEADFERFFTPITEEIFKCARTAAIWYHEPGQQITDMDVSRKTWQDSRSSSLRLNTTFRSCH